eukprot:3002555-Rhodomonas_salina.2
MQSSAVIDSILKSRFFAVKVCHHSLPDAPSPYTAFRNLSTFPSPSIGSNPFGGLKYTGFGSSALRYAVFTSPCRMYQPFATAIAMSVRIVIGCAIGEKVSP